jgi:hypothetical protein
VTTHDDLAVAAGHRADPGRWLGIFDDLSGGEAPPPVGISSELWSYEIAGGSAG